MVEAGGFQLGRVREGNQDPDARARRAALLPAGVPAREQLAQCFATCRPAPTELPTFLALGRYDYLIPYTVWDGPKKSFANLTERMYERSAHTPQFEQSEEFTAEIVSWAALLT